MACQGLLAPVKIFPMGPVFFCREGEGPVLWASVVPESFRVVLYASDMTKEWKVFVERLRPEAVIPRMAHVGEDLAFDVFAPRVSPDLLDEVVAFRVFPHGVRFRIHTGLRLFLPRGVGALVESRSGVAWDGVDAVAGRIDPGYRGPLWVMLHSAGTLEETRHWLEARILSGKAIAQLRFVRVLDVQVVEGKPAEDWARKRGEGGFGSTDRRNEGSSL